MGLLTEREDVTGSFGKISLISVLQKRKFFSRQFFVSFLDLMYPLTCSSHCMNVFLLKNMDKKDSYLRQNKKVGQ